MYFCPNKYTHTHTVPSWLQSCLLCCSSAGFPPSAYVIPPPVAFPGLQVNPGFTFSSGPFLQPGIHAQAGSQTTKQTHIPYSQQRPSGPSPAPGLGQGPCGGTMNQGQPPQAQAPSQANLQQSVQLQVLNQQQQSPTKLVQQAPIGKSPPHHPGLQQVGTILVLDLF